MLQIFYSFIIPVYNRPDEIKELLTSFLEQESSISFEIIIVEDGSDILCKSVVESFSKQLDVRYYFKENSGPGLSRNYGMQKAKGTYFIILDSDVLLPKNYLKIVNDKLLTAYVDAFGGVDMAHDSFTAIQKAINFAMTSFLTTGGLRNTTDSSDFFQLRSFNMGISKKVFMATKGFSKQRFGEDIELSHRIKKMGFSSCLFLNAIVYHKRRANFNQFFNQTFNFGSTRPILNKMYKNTAKITYWFPTVFIFGLLVSVLLSFYGMPLFLFAYFLYFLLVFVLASVKEKSIYVGLLSVIAVFTQFLGYGIGFFRSQVRLHVQHKSIKETFPKMFS